MKKLSLLFAVFFAVSVFGQGMKFEENKSFKELLALAKKENKLLFVDAFTTWCGPCKLMAKNVFPQESVGNFYNANFINSKIDMEKGEGIDIAKKYKVMAYPTYLFLNGDGELIHRVTSYYEPAEFIAVGKDAVDPAKQMGALKAKFEAGDKNPEFLKSFIKVFAFADQDLAVQAATQYFSQVKNAPLSQEDLSYLFTLTKDNNSPLYPEIINRKEELLKIIPEANYSKILESLKLNGIFNTAYDKNTSTFDEQKYIAEASKYFGPDEVKTLVIKAKMRIAASQKDKATYQKLAIEYYQDGLSPKFNSNELNSVAWDFFENTDNRAYLTKALLWAQQSVKLAEGYANSDTVANIYYKLGDQANAKTWATKAIELAKKEGSDYESTQELLEKVK